MMPQTALPRGSRLDGSAHASLGSARPSRLQTTRSAVRAEERMARKESGPPFDEFDARLERMKGRADAPQRKHGAIEARTPWGGGIQVGIELVAGVAGGVLFGWALDSWLGTAPWLLIVGFVLGAAAGTLNAWRWMQRFEQRTREGPDRRQ